MDAVIVFDADNTLWDTNAVFWSAQVSLLKTFAKAGFLTRPESEVQTLRALDREMIDQLGKAEYDFRILATSVAYFYCYHSTVSEAVGQALSGDTDSITPKCKMLIDDANQAFIEGLKQVPCLFADTKSVLSSLHTAKSSENNIAVIMFSEGNPKRLEQILKTHHIREKGFFNEIIISHKSKEAFEAIKAVGLKRLSKKSSGTIFIMVGDSLHRDIKFGNQAGFITVYKPSGFKGKEVPNKADERPTYIIDTLSELPAVFRNLGISIDECRITERQ